MFELRCAGLVVERFKRWFPSIGQYMSEGGRLTHIENTLYHLPVYCCHPGDGQTSWKNCNLLGVAYEKLNAIPNGLPNNFWLTLQQACHDILLGISGWISLLAVALENLGSRIYNLLLVFYLLLT